MLVAKNEYNELGQLARKSLHSENDGSIFLQHLDYQWHPRGWLQAVNNTGDLQESGEYPDLFAYRLRYEDLPGGVDADPQFNGNISGAEWQRTAFKMDVDTVAKDTTWKMVPDVRRRFLYDYDDLNQLTKATYGQFENNTDWNYSTGYNTSYDYDLNGNMQWAKRHDERDLIDDLTYHYKGNLLQGVDDAAGAGGGMDFSDNGSSFADGQEYFYDANGNMIEDLNKGIESIDYNAMNLPETVTWEDGREIRWEYTAGGSKLKKKVYEGGTKVFTQHYVGGYVYRDSTLEFFAFDEGRVRNHNGSFRYEYDLKDHLGNVRATFASEDGMPKLLQQDDYYPFGLKFNSSVNGPENQFTYNGKELEDEHGLNWYHYGARFYDPQLGRWHAVDPLDIEHSPYNYAFNDPINYTDPDGTVPLDWIRNNETGEYVWDGNVNSASDTPDGFSYVGKSLSDIFAHYQSNLSFLEQLVGLDSGPDIDFSGWRGEYSAWDIQDNVAYGYPGKDLPWWASIGGVGKSSGSALKWLKGLFKSKGGTESAKLIAQFSSKTIDDAVAYAMKGSKVEHLFAGKHKLKPLVTQLGGREKTVRAILNSANGKLPASGIFENIPVNVGGQTIYIRGNVHNGIPKLGTMFIK